MQDLLAFLLKKITGREFDIKEREENGNLIYTIHCSEEDAGMVIGKGGKTIKALQEIMRIKAKIDRTFISLQVDTTS